MPMSQCRNSAITNWLQKSLGGPVLYNLYEAQHTALAPLRYMAELSRGWFGHPFSPLSYSPFARRLAASSDLFLRVTQRYEKPAWDTAAAEVEVALEKPFCNLIPFKQ